MTTVFNVPSSLAKAKSELGALGKLLTVTEWERAATVWAFTYEGRGGPRTGNKTSQLSIREFAELGIQGLTSRPSVTAYRDQWKRAMELAGASDVQPGDTIRLPNLEWDWSDNDHRQTRYSQRTPGSFAASIARKEVAADALAQDLTDRDAVDVVARILEDRPHLVARAHGTVSGRRADLPEAPFDTPPIVGDPQTSRAVDDTSYAQRLGNAVFAFAQRALDAYGNKRRTQYLLREAERHYEQLGIVIDALNGVGDDLEEVVEGWS